MSTVDVTPFSSMSSLLTIIVKFRMIVFRPFKGEIMLGKIASGTEHGIKSVFPV